MGLLDPADWEAQWIAESGIVESGAKAAAEKPLPASMLRKEFAVRSSIRRATVYVTARGLYELFINGERVGDHILASEWTDYHTRVQYQTYDVSHLVREGENAVGAVLGDGWYAGRIGLLEGRCHHTPRGNAQR